MDEYKNTHVFTLKSLTGYWKSFIKQYQNYTRISMFYTGFGIIFTGSSTVLILVIHFFQWGDTPILIVIKTRNPIFLYSQKNLSES